MNYLLTAFWDYRTYMLSSNCIPQGSSLLALHQLLITYIYLTYAWLILDYLSRHRSLHISSLSRAHVFQKPVFFDFFRYIWEKQIFEGLWRLFLEKNMIFEGFSACFWRSLMFVIFVYSAATLLHSYSGHTANYSYSGQPPHHPDDTPTTPRLHTKSERSQARLHRDYIRSQIEVRTKSARSQEMAYSQYPLPSFFSFSDATHCYGNTASFSSVNLYSPRLCARSSQQKSEKPLGF